MLNEGYCFLNPQKWHQSRQFGFVGMSLLQLWNMSQCSMQICNTSTHCNQWRIQDFSEVAAPTPRGGANIRFCQKFPKNCMKLKEFGPPGGRGASKILLCRSATGNRTIVTFFSFCGFLWFLKPWPNGYFPKISKKNTKLKKKVPLS